jgi:hypothetical protein
MLQLAPAALAKVTAPRSGAVRPRHQPAIWLHDVTRRGAGGKASIRRDAIALGGEANNKARLSHIFWHRQAA